MENEFEPPKKKSKTSNCVICDRPLGDEPVTKNPTVAGLTTLLDAAQVRKDEVHKRLSSSREKILAGTIKIAFHRSCRASYTSKQNLQHAAGQSDSEHLPSTSQSQDTICHDATSERRLLRADISNFNIRSQCFVCAQSYKRKEKLTPISTGTGKSTRENMLRAAEERRDEEMRLRMLAHDDLFALDASYHRSCYAAYISKRNIQAARTRNESEHSETLFKKGFKLLCDELKNSVFSSNKPLLSLSEMNSRFIEILQSVGVTDSESYKSWKLKEKLKGYFGDRLIFISQSGKSDLMCSNELTLGEALKRVNNLQLERSHDNSIDFVSTGDLTDSTILHRAASIVRKSISNVSFISDYYPSSGEIDIHKCVEFVPTSLVEFISWCTSQVAFESAMGFTDGCCSNNLLQVLAICQNIIGLNQNTATPFSFGLGIQLHHKFGSRELIEVLNELGYSIPYDEVRRFLTSVAEEDQKNEGPYIPRGIARYKEEDPYSVVDAAIDNFDQNEETLDGKFTTHSMAAVLYQRSVTADNVSGIRRSKSKALDVTQYSEDALSIYSKPHTRPEPKPVAEKCVFEVQQGESQKQAELRDYVWKICRNMEDVKSLPSWAGFNAMVSESKIPVATVRYLPFIKAPPSDFSTVYTIILKLISIVRYLGQPHIMVTADLAIYSKAQQLIWDKSELQDSVTMRLGGMHLLMAFMASIGKLYGDGGFLDILTSSGVYASGTAQLMLQGKHYARGIRGIKIAHEAMTHLFLSAAEVYAKKNGLPWIDDEVHELAINLQESIQMKNQSSCSEICQLLEIRIANVVDTLSQFKTFGNTYSGTFKYWISFLEAGDLLLRLIRADKEADFELHLNSVMETVPYFHLAGRTNYARYTPIYVSEMRQLASKQPAMYQFLAKGGFVVRRSDKTKFNSVSTDQALEQTINREAKGTGGIIGFTMRKAALLRWLMTRHVSGEYSEAFEQLLGHRLGRSLHEELGPARISRDRTDVSAIKDYIKEHCQDPFDLENVPKELINITTGQIASKAIEESLTSIPEKGKASLDKFVTVQLMNGESKHFWDAIPKSKVTTFASMKKALSFDKDRKVVLAPEVLFRRLLSVAKHRDIDMRMVLSFELSPVPPAMFHDDGTMRKTTKSDLANVLENNCQSETNLKSDTHIQTAYIIDGMAFVQGINESQFKTFDDIGEIVVKRLVRLFKNPDLDVDTVTLIFDRYDVTSSIKGNERQRRGDTGVEGPSHKIVGKRQVPSYRQFLKSGQNKAVLIYFLSQYIEENIQERIPQGRKLVVAGGYHNREVVREITDNGIRDLEELFSTHDEADTRIILHAVHLSTFPRTIVRCDDTDVLVLLLYYQSGGYLSTDVYMHAGHTGKFVTKERYIPVSKIAETIGSEQCSILPAMHALTGCDSTSGFFRLGKKTAYRILQKHQDILKGLSDFHHPHTEGLDTATKLILLMYTKGSKKTSCNTLDELRYSLSSQTDKPVSALPPTDDAFRQHALRAKFQTMVWCNSHIAKPEKTDPTEYGWVQSGDSLQCKTSLKESVPKEIRDLTHLYCKDTDCNDGRKCPCILANLNCIEICSCNSCPNIIQVLQDSDNSPEDED